ncbi:AAA domain-containing protein, partial [Actinoplanes sp. NPDC049596]|uniref:AAA domain-containing protein n=1 Tax=Actinoplanes sp. NPDC049596 TaxID=3154625 RepID=UPI00341BC59E
EPRTLVADAAEEAAHRHSEDADALDEVLRDAGPLASRLGLPPVATFADLSRLASIADLASRPNRPEPFWFGPGVLAGVSAAATALRRSAEAVTAAEAQARRYFHESIVDQPVEQLADRLTNVHRGLRKLFRAYRRDWEAVAAFAVPSMAPAEAVAHLGTAVAWKVALREQVAAERQYAPLLGRYWQRQATDYRAIHEAVQVAGELLRLSPPESVQQVADQLGKPVPGLARIAGQARRAREPEAETIREEIAALRARVEPLKTAATALRAYSRACEREVDLAEALRLARLRKAVVEAEQELAARTDQDAALTGLAGPGEGLAGPGEGLAGPGEGLAGLGDTLAGLGDGLDEAIGWASAARRLATGTDRPLSEQQAAALGDNQGAGALAERAGAWEQARNGILAAFATTRHEEIGAALDAYGSQLLDDLIEDRTGQDEWFGYLSARRVLASHGLDAAVDSCAEQQLPPERIREVLGRALLAAWADAVIRSDRRLHPGGSAERDRLVAEFRRMDAALADAAPATIAAALTERKAAGRRADDVALLRREGMKETRHLAVRDLIGRTRDTVLAIKPCFLMSPLAVSQFLPSDLSFDVVIFDEASQITPGDAVNCVYRASAMIAAGDDKQLPPTSFFSVSAEAPAAVDLDADEEPAGDVATDVNDFQSVLELAKACGAFRTLGLAWHYRSRHEALIAFANHAFYQGRLITFPGATESDPDAGVELIPAGGVYRRGTTRDNPVEAERVAERIVHRLTTRPEESLGVVTFSVAQAEAIEAALDRAVAKHPGLERYLDGDRLNGLFVKSLESVQGDERDVMIFSIGYAHDEDGKISTNFGALNQRNGWRRLNVAITRARRRVEIVSSIRARDIPASANEGVRQLAAYLDYAERGLAPASRSTAVDLLADEIATLVQSWGYRTRTAVGAAGYRVDIGVRHPAYEGEVFALGIQCDGPRYASIAAARDRDRISAEMLAGLGWRLHRIWGTAWHRDRPGEQARLRAAIEDAVGALPATSAQSYRRVDLVRLQPVS